MRSLLFSLVSGAHETLRMHFKSGVPVSPWKCCDQTPLAFKTTFSGCSSSSCCQTLRLRSLTWGSELSFLWENFCGIIIFQFMNFPHGRYGIWFYCFWEPLFPSCCGLFFVFGCRVSFFFFLNRFQCFFGWCLFISCYCAVFIRRGELTSFYSAVLSPQKLVLKSTVTHPLTYTHTRKDHLGFVIICYFKFHSDLYVVCFYEQLWN